jgi:hypothetical protein
MQNTRTIPDAPVELENLSHWVPADFRTSRDIVSQPIHYVTAVDTTWFLLAAQSPGGVARLKANSAISVLFLHGIDDMTLERRITEIERTNRKLRLTVLCMAGGLALSLWSNAGPNGLDLQPATMAAETQDDTPVQQLIRARKIQLVGENGQVLISLQGSKWGNILTYNDQGKTMVTISATNETDGQGGISTFDPKFGRLVRIGANRTDGAIATFDARTGKKLVSISSDGSRGGGMNSFDRAGKRYNHLRRPVD